MDTLKNQAAQILNDWPLIGLVNAALMLAAQAAIDYATAMTTINSVINQH